MRWPSFASGFVLGVVHVLQWLGNHALAEVTLPKPAQYLSEGLELTYRDGAKRVRVLYFGPLAALAAVEEKFAVNRQRWRD